jgi:hypothetical protein
MLLVAALAVAPESLEPADSLWADQQQIDEEFFRIVQRVFPGRTGTSSVALPSREPFVRAAAPLCRSTTAGARSIPRARTRSPPGRTAPSAERSRSVAEIDRCAEVWCWP